MKVKDIKAKDVVDKNYFSVSKDDEMRKVLNKIKEEDVFAVPVTEDGKLEGLVTWRNVIRRSTPPKAKVKKLLLHPPKVEGDINLVEVGEKMLESGSRAVTVHEDGKFIGIITQKEIIGAISKDETFASKSMEDLSPEVVTIKEDRSIGKAKALMREEGIARLPVVDNEDKLVGSVDVAGIVKTLHPEKAMQVGERKGESLPERDSPVTAIMNKTPLTVSLDTSLREASRKMTKEGSLYVIAVEEREPKAIVTPKDIIELVASRKKREGAYIQLAGLKNFDSFQKDKMLDMAERKVQKAGRMFEDVQRLIIHVKSQNTDGENAQYYTRVRLFTSDGLFIAKQDWEWEITESVNKCLEKLEKRFTKHHEKNVEKDRHRGKYHEE